jgi:hypothetical protein
MSKKERRVNEELRGRRIRLVGDSRGAIARCARLLNTPYRTYQDWELGNAAAPGAVLVALDALLLLADLAPPAESARAQLIGLDLCGQKDPIPVKLREILDRLHGRFGEILSD